MRNSNSSLDQFDNKELVEKVVDKQNWSLNSLFFLNDFNGPQEPNVHLAFPL